MRSGVAARFDQIQPAGAHDAGKRLQKHRLHPGEHGGVRADSDAERYDDHSRDHRHPDDRSPRVAQIIEHHALPANSRVSVGTLIFSPSLLNIGTRISIPVSTVATFVTLPLAVSPRAPCSVAVTVNSTWAGNSRPIGLSLYVWIWTITLSARR